MKIIRTKFLRLIGMKMIATPWAIYAAPKAIIKENDIMHESIHAAQWKEMLYVFFPLWYAIEYLVRLNQYKDAHAAYKNISFEREAYENENDINYLENRKLFNWMKYV